MVHPDYQYTPLLVPAMAGMVACGVYDVVLASRILGGGALKGGMPLYKYVANRFLTAFQNLFLGVKFSEYHTGFRAFSRELLETLAAARELRRFCFRQPDDRPGCHVRFPDRRNLLPDEVFQRGIFDQFPAFRYLRLRASSKRQQGLSFTNWGSRRAVCLSLVVER